MAGKTEYKYAWAKANLVRITLDVPPEFKQDAQSAASAAGQSLRAFIMQAVAERVCKLNGVQSGDADKPE